MIAARVFFYFLPLIIFGWFPWVGYFLVAFWDNIRKFYQEKANTSSELVFLLTWPLFIFIFFSLSDSKLIPYITPVFPPLAILVGKTLNQIWESRRDDRRIINLSCLVSVMFIIAVSLTTYQGTYYSTIILNAITFLL